MAEVLERVSEESIANGRYPALIGSEKWFWKWILVSAGAGALGFVLSKSDGYHLGYGLNGAVLGALFGALAGSTTLPLRSRHRAAQGDAPARLWVQRGGAVGVVLGSAYGSVFPIIGTAIGAAGGGITGLIIGVIVALEGRAARRLLPTTPCRTARREQLFAVVTIAVFAWTVAGGRRGFTTDSRSLIYVPAAIGVVHTMLAGPLSSSADYFGATGPIRRRVLFILPFAIALANFAAAFWVSDWPIDFGPVGGIGPSSG